jgi:magnesium-transporting ATPase (P-type)
MSLGKDKYY